MGCWLKANKAERLSQRGKETGMAGKKKVWSLIPFGLIKMCLFGVFCSSLPGKKEILQSKSLKSSFTEIHMCNIAYK